MSENLSVTSDSVSRSFQNAAGPIDYGFTNDYMFRAILQRNNRVLKGLICSLLHLHPDDILSVEITNPIFPGDDFDAKEFMLDIEVDLSNDVMLNLEMQVDNENNWPERSLSYLCRRFGQRAGLYRLQACHPHRVSELYSISKVSGILWNI